MLVTISINNQQEEIHLRLNIDDPVNALPAHYLLNAAKQRIPAYLNIRSRFAGCH